MIFFFIPLCEAVFWYPNLAEYTIGWDQNEKVPVYIILNIFKFRAHPNSTFEALKEM